MPRSLPPLTALRAFEAASRLASFARAARELHVTPAAVSHQIRGLEQYLGVTLFRRTGRRLVLTEQGQAAAEQFREGFERLARGVDMLRGDAERGSLTVSVTPAFATRWLVPRLGRFTRRFPGIGLRIKASSQPVDFDHDEVDVAIRIGRGAVSGARVLPLFGESVAPLASPTFIRQHRVRRPSDLARVPLLHDQSLRRAGRPPGWSEWFQAAGVTGVDDGSGLHFDDGHLVLQAAAGGRGVALGRIAYALDDLARKHLRMPFGPVLDMRLRYNLLLPETRTGEPAIDAFSAWCQQEALSFAPKLDGFAAGGGSAAIADVTQGRSRR